MSFWSLNPKVFYWKCLRCGECCRHLTSKRFGMPLLPEEAWRLQHLAKRLGVTVNIKPLASDGFRVTLYQMADEVCPFLSGNRCMIYEQRPIACRAYPLRASGVARCEAVERMRRMYFGKNVPINFPPWLKYWGKVYSRTIFPRLQSALMLCDLNGRWRLKRGNLI